MITPTLVTDNIFRIHVAGKLEESDFPKMAAQLDPRLRTGTDIRLLIDLTDFRGWANSQAAAKHFAFVRERQKMVERIAVIAGAEWQHWVAGILSVFVHPEIHVFSKGEDDKAESWLKQRKAA